MPTRIAAVFEDLKAQGKMAFMPFLTAGDPDTDTTLKIITELAARGVDLIEVGFPYSDPIADGPVIQASYTRALDNGFQVQHVFDGIGSLDTDNLPPLVAMVSYAIVFRLGPEAFADKAKNAGFSGFIVPDLPADEGEAFAKIARARALDLVQLIAPTTPPERAERILSTGSGFLYCISTAGTTGVRDSLPSELQDQLDCLRDNTELPLAVGFGISKPEQVDTLRGHAHGIIVGSAIVRKVEAFSQDGADTDKCLAEIGDYVSSMVAVR